LGRELTVGRGVLTVGRSVQLGRSALTEINGGAEFGVAGLGVAEFGTAEFGNVPVEI
jgi:hypothetical protein